MAKRAAKSSKKKPAELQSSSDILIDPTGEIYTNILEKLLYDAHEKGLHDSDSVVVIIHDKRLNDIPEYENVRLVRSVRWLKKTYAGINGVAYVHERKNLEEKYRPRNPFAL